MAAFMRHSKSRRPRAASLENKGGRHQAASLDNAGWLVTGLVIRTREAGQPPYGGVNRIRFEGYVSLRPVKRRTGDPWRAVQGSRNVEYQGKSARLKSGMQECASQFFPRQIRAPNGVPGFIP